MPRKIFVSMISTSYPRHEKDWQGIFIRKLNDALAERPDINLSLWAPPGPHHHNITSLTSDADSVWLEKMANKGGIANILRGRKIAAKFAFISGLLSRLYRIYHSKTAQPYVLHINWLQNALPLLRANRPAVISVLGTDYKLLKLPLVTWGVKYVLKWNNCVIAPNAEWMEDGLREKFGSIARIHTVPFGVDKDWYDIKRTYSHAGPRKWLVVLRITKSKMGNLFDWGADMVKNGDELHLFGPMQEQLHIPEWVHYHGAVTPESLSQHWFPSAAGLISLSQHNEGRPQVMLEAMAAGLPIVASNLPAHKNLIRDGETGILVDSKRSFLRALEYMSNTGNNAMISKNAKNYAREAYGTWADCAQRYALLYKELSTGQRGAIR